MKPEIWIDKELVSSFKFQVSSTSEAAKPITDLEVILISEDEALRAFKIDDKMYFANKAGNIIYKDGDKIIEEEWKESKAKNITITKTKEAAAPREIPMGSQKVAAMPTNEDFENAAVWTLNISPSLSGRDSREGVSFLKISYAGDCARVYADGKLVMDNFWNGKPMLVRMSDLAGKKVELRILPLSKDAPIYLQKEQKKILDNSKTALLQLNSINILKIETSTK
jgi:hypothetical protein